MAESANLKNRDFSSDTIDEDDPLMELSRIIGLEPRREAAPRREEPVLFRQERAPEPEVAELSAAASHIDEDIAVEALQPEPELFQDDDLQVDFGDELIASLQAEELESDVLAPSQIETASLEVAAVEAQDGYWAAAQEPLTELETEAEAPQEEAAEVLPDFLSAPMAAEPSHEPVPHLVISPAAAPSIEDELEALLNAANDRKSTLGLRPVAEALEDVEPVEDNYADYSEPATAYAKPVFDPIDIPLPQNDVRIDMNFDAEPEMDALEADMEMAEAEFDVPEFEPENHSAAAEIDDEVSEMPVLEVEETALADEFHAAVRGYSYSEPQAAPAEPIAVGVAAEPFVDAVQHEARAIEVTDEFEIPEFTYEDTDNKPAQQTEFAGYDEDYSSAPRNSAVPAAAAHSDPAPVAELDDFDLDQINEAIEELEQERARAFAPEEALAAVAVAAAAKPAKAERQEFVLDRHEDPAVFPEPSSLRPAASRASNARGYLLAAGLGALALVGGIGAYALTSGSDSPTGASAPVVLKADAEPVKIAPENPGGSVVPNQDVAVYDKVAGADAEADKQTALVTAAVEPVNLAEKAVTRVVLPGPSATEPSAESAKSEERIDPQAAEEQSVVGAEVASVSPKKVRTLVVKSDGSLVERTGPAVSASDETAAITPVMVKPSDDSLIPAKKVQTKSVDAATTSAAAAAPIQAAEADQSTLDPVKDVAKAKVEPAAAETVAAVEEPKAVEKAAEPVVAEAVPAAEAKPVVKTVKLKKIKPQAAAPEAEVEVAAAANVPLVEARPADQPVNIVAKTGKTPDAAPEAEAAAAPAAASGAYVIQIASAPSPDAAQSTYSTLSRKFGNVIGGRAVTIQKADIPGKGTFYRVRVAAGSKKEAAALCTKYKSAGGQCLVAR